MKKLVILGGGESGVGTALLGKKQGYEVFVSDNGKLKNKYKDVLEHNEIEWEENGHTVPRLLKADLVMKSPGIPDHVSVIRQLKEAGIPVISEIEFASRYTDATLIGITGSNGKTTTTMLTYHLLKSAGLHVGMAGNIGDSFAAMVASQDYDYYVLEISSFQLDGIIDFRPHIAVITNISPDHLDRYENDYSKYIASKFRITMNQNDDDWLIYDADNEEITTWLASHKTRAGLLPFSLMRKPDEGAYIENQTMTIKINNDTNTMTTESLTLEGKHNQKNAMAASAVAQLLKIRKSTIRESMQSFQGVEHRLEKVLKIKDVQYINDSKATNVNATYYALDSMKAPTVWIVGGVDKGNDYLALMPLVREKVKAVVCLGVDNRKLVEAFGNVVDVLVETTDMEEAVKIARKVADKGDTVLLSPACASFDLFENYEDRGRKFKEAVRNL
ncbi:UDP-N-acetylmuramoyl-L-alanine--D-glutamate ligase [Robertkochia aurantiaca]|uniref:UDP-N-acetylmuramoyl-L-alanine--D-glutamate ligase n=1 Tax=Robertkochia aurantiaca TaxID=2873700 RepID=UPI001CCB3BB6|nr:UDP-N-acetylmuramoyl-L-alanine--D-glutamate ligase [Robertkochia sp. 3YJGBD-33]